MPSSAEPLNDSEMEIIRKALHNLRVQLGNGTTSPPKGRLVRLVEAEVLDLEDALVARRLFLGKASDA